MCIARTQQDGPRNALVDVVKDGASNELRERLQVLTLNPVRRRDEVDLNFIFDKKDRKSTYMTP